MTLSVIAELPCSSHLSTLSLWVLIKKRNQICPAWWLTSKSKYDNIFCKHSENWSKQHVPQGSLIPGLLTFFPPYPLWNISHKIFIYPFLFVLIILMWLELSPQCSSEPCIELILKRQSLSRNIWNTIVEILAEGKVRRPVYHKLCGHVEKIFLLSTYFLYL